jgi:hypothetical protein
MNSLVATRMPPCAPAAAMPTAISVAASGSTAQATPSPASLSMWMARAGSGFSITSGTFDSRSRAWSSAVPMVRGSMMLAASMPNQAPMSGLRPIWPSRLAFLSRC